MNEIRTVDIENGTRDFADLGFATREEMEAFVQEGIDSIEQHGTIPHAVVMAELDALLARRTKG